MEEISLWLDSYDEIYSDFDSRQYIKRRISEDFLHELRLELKYIETNVQQLNLFIPSSFRNKELEVLIAPSLLAYFTKLYEFHQAKFKTKTKNGLYYLLFGIILMFLNSFLVYHLASNFIVKVLNLLFEPASWFLIWLGFDVLFYDLKALKIETNFFDRLRSLNIVFKSS